MWWAIYAAIDALQAEGASKLRVRDAGCGLGTRTLRIAARAQQLGLSLKAVGLDIAAGQ